MDQYKAVKPYLSAEDAAKSLGISLETLYAYVSRGRIHSEPVEPGSRLRRYRSADVVALKERRTYRRAPQLAAGRALDWGWPVLESKLTLIDQGALYYRGQDAIVLAATKSFETVAAAFLEISPEQFLAAGPRVRALLDKLPVEAKFLAKGARPLAALQTLLPCLDLRDSAAPVSSPELMPSRAGDIFYAALALATGNSPLSSRPAAAQLASVWCPGIRGAAPLINAALILCLDHELNVSSFTARTVASSGASVYQAVLAALAAMQGWRHGGATLRVEALWDEIDRRGDPEAVLREHRHHAGSLPGFGHPLYPAGDPRARFLFRQLEAASRRSPIRLRAEALRAQGEALTGEAASVDFALVAVSRCLGLPRQSGLTLFTLGRIVGWVAHAAEQSRSGVLIRPRARYVGSMPT